MGSKSVKFNLQSINKPVQEAANWIISPALPPGHASVDCIYEAYKEMCHNCERLSHLLKEVDK